MSCKCSDMPSGEWGNHVLSDNGCETGLLETWTAARSHRRHFYENHTHRKLAVAPGYMAKLLASLIHNNATGENAVRTSVAPGGTRRSAPHSDRDTRLPTRIATVWWVAQYARPRRFRSRLAEKEQPGILRPEESPEILWGRAFQRQQARRGKFQGWIAGRLRALRGDVVGPKKTAGARRLDRWARRGPFHVLGIRRKEE